MNGFTLSDDFKVKYLLSFCNSELNYKICLRFIAKYHIFVPTKSTRSGKSV